MTSGKMPYDLGTVSSITTLFLGGGGGGGITRGVYSSGSPTTNVIQYITIATLGNATDFGLNVD